MIDFFSTKTFSGFFWWPIPIPNFPKIPKITLRKSCDEFKDVKIRLFEILVYLYVAARIRSGENPTFWPLNFQIFWKISKKNLRKKIQNFFFDRKNIFSQTYTIARFLICLHYEPKDYVKPKILWIRDFCAVTRICWDFIAPEQCCLNWPGNSGVVGQSTAFTVSTPARRCVLSVFF